MSYSIYIIGGIFIALNARFVSGNNAPKKMAIIQEIAAYLSTSLALVAAFIVSHVR